ncbi:MULTISPECIES: gp16 family protein [unclassified Acinetobacter]|uniref:gp16 family protein n=1 Tax=unclassified Acinetobacter TaxID=196816 RepID=UPI00190DBD4F|nr:MULTISPECIES: regulatory protein GemA [unclassified Acinetobacter]MBK0062404.1 regulatory protein GemA [Acinetobacter sp. S55]MBK0066208.1 regulatory protein GemA [Acinetobacter sp. S54]
MKKASRNQRIAAIHMGKKQLGLDEDIYRDLLEQVTGKRSAKDMTDDDLVKVLQHMEKLGFSKKEFGHKPSVTLSKAQLINKIEALLADMGKHWNYAHGCARKMFKKDQVQFCTEYELWKVVAALEINKKRKSKDG